MKKKMFLFFLPLLSLTLIVACSTETGSYQDLKVYHEALYSDVIQKSFTYEGPGRNPVIVIHGLLGSKLEDTSGKNIWGNFSASDMRSSNLLTKLAHPMRFGVPLRNLKSGVKPTAMLEKSQVSVLGLSFEYAGYDVLVNMLEKSGYIPESSTLPNGKHFYSQFLFYYDWRRDISENAARLHEFVLEKRKYLQEQYHERYGLKDYDVKFDIIAHSMGGLLARYFMRYGGVVLPDDPMKLPELTMAGAKFANKLIIVATPNAGFVDTLLELIAGLRLAPGAPLYPKTIIGTFPSYYQMLPDAEGNRVQAKGESVDYFNSATWVKYKWGLADPGTPQDEWLKKMLPGVDTPELRYKTALDHLNKCLLRAAQFKHAMRIPVKLPDNVSVYLISGDALLTNDAVEVDPNTGNVRVSRQDAGDGKITATSARQDLRTKQNWLPFLVSPIDWHAVYYLQGGHMGIMSNPAFETNLRYILLAAPTRHQKQHVKEYKELLDRIAANESKSGK